MAYIDLDGTYINDTSKPYIIAEIGSNHGGDVSVCERMIEIAAFLGINAVKLQKRDNQNLFTKKFFNSPYKKSKHGKTYGEHRMHLELSPEDFFNLKDFAHKKNITFFATPFDHESLNFLEQLKTPFYKIQSGDVPNLPLIDAICKTKKPIILSTGGATEWQIDQAVELIKSHKNPLAILHCIALYPTLDDDICIDAIKGFKERYKDHVIGFSSHYPGILASIGAYMNGAQIIEQHYSIADFGSTTDYVMSLKPNLFKQLIQALSSLHTMRTKNFKNNDLIKREKDSITKLSKSLYCLEDMKKGDILSFDKVGCKIPYDDNGLPISILYKHNKYFYLKKDHKKGELISLTSV